MYPAPLARKPAGAPAKPHPPRSQRLAAPETRVARYLAGLSPAYAATTQRSLRSDWRCFSRWCAANARRAFPAPPATVVAYLEALAPGHSLATLKRRLATLSHLHSALGQPNPRHHAAVRLALRGFARSKGDYPEHRRQALRQVEVDAMIAALDDSLRDTRDRALLLVARDTLARRGELARLGVADIGLTPAGDGRVRLRRTKGDGSGRIAWLAPETGRALAAWLARAGVTKGAVFRQLDSEDRVGAGLRPQGIARRLKAMAQRAGLEAGRISGHSTRLGMCCDLVADGASLVAVQLAGGWRSPAMPAHYAADLLPELGAVAHYHRGRA